MNGKEEKLQNVTCFATLPKASHANHILTIVRNQLPKAKSMTSGDLSEVVFLKKLSRLDLGQ